MQTLPTPADGERTTATPAPFRPVDRFDLDAVMVRRSPRLARLLEVELDEIGGER